MGVGDGNESWCIGRERRMGGRATRAWGALKKKLNKKGNEERVITFLQPDQADEEGMLWIAILPHGDDSGSIL
jgi:hypothetical protein